RCHNHKFDPITQEHYYSLQAVFAALDRADRPYDPDINVARIRYNLLREKTRLEGEKASLDEEVQKLGGPTVRAIDEQLFELDKQKSAKPQPEFGYHSNIESNEDTTKWVQVDLGEVTEIHSIAIVGCHDDFGGIGHGFGFPKRFKIEAATDAEFETPATIVDRTGSDVDNPGTNPQSVDVPNNLKARYVRITATKLATRQKDYIFALAELMVLNAAGENVALGKDVSSLDSIEAPVRWQRKNLVDGYYFGVAADPKLRHRIETLQDKRKRHLTHAVGPDLKVQIDANARSLAEINKQIAALPKQQMVYTGTVHTGGGTFTGTGANGGKPRAIHVLHRGNILTPRKEVGPGTVPLIADADWQFSLPASHVESDRRIALAEWLTRPDNPLTWRSIVNRIWQYHFGRGVVDSPNDFGRMGKPPSHPELLDWLASEFRDGDQRFKTLHKTIVMSSVYRQSSAHNEANAQIDSGNEFLWRMNRRRLSAEEVRDSVLSVSGKLNREMYGPGFQVFVLERPEHSPHYEYHKHDPDDETTHRRSIYRFIVRSQPDPFMTTLDCADSSQSVAKRDETLTALQALSLLNNKFMLQMAEHFAERVSNLDGDQQITGAFRLATGRQPDEAVRSMLAEYATRHGNANLCRLLFNLNEFVFLD
ncbi:MAG: DUF1553 domain-containing protein, partial [Planctomycetales bacterium]|nr:DUF1553 domain-containing protein [Planctomycetales bacterium]